jgi:MoxR-like ATPase
MVRAALPALRHRILLNFEAEADGVTSDALVEGIVEQVRAADRDPITV